jgi:hypothetical protein
VSRRTVVQSMLSRRLHNTPLEEDCEAAAPGEREPEEPNFGYDPDRQDNPWTEYFFLKEDEGFEY